MKTPKNLLAPPFESTIPNWKRTDGFEVHFDFHWQAVAVAARSLEDAKKFGKTHNIPRAYGSYEELAKDPNIGQCSVPLDRSILRFVCTRSYELSVCADVVYIGTIQTNHLSSCLLFLNAKKPVLCEKSLAMTSKEVKEILACAKKNNVFLMEVIEEQGDAARPPKFTFF